jgi:hypothetical protein
MDGGEIRNCSIGICPPFPAGIRTFYRQTTPRFPAFGSINFPGKLSEIEFSFHQDPSRARGPI